MCIGGIPCIYVKVINSFFEEDQTTTGKTLFYLWLIDNDGKDEKERHLKERFDNYNVPMTNEEWEEKLFLSIVQASRMRKNAYQATMAQG